MSPRMKLGMLMFMYILIANEHVTPVASKQFGFAYFLSHYTSPTLQPFSDDESLFKFVGVDLVQNTAADILPQ